MKTLDYLNLDEKRVTDVVKGLNLLLANLQVYYTNLRGFHWNIKGKGFFTLHAKFEELYNDTAEKIDEVAERLLQLNSVPENRFSRYLKAATIQETGNTPCGHEVLYQVMDMVKELIRNEREILRLASEAQDEVTVSLMADYLKEQEKLIWMLVAFNSQKPEEV